MVSSDPLRTKLRAAYGLLRQSALDVHGYKGPMFDAAFDLMTTESALAGIADTLISGSRVPQEHAGVLRTSVLSDDTRLNLSDGTTVDLSGTPVLLEHARLLEQIRVLSLQVSGE